MGRARGGPAVPLPLLRGRRRHRPAARHLGAGPLRRRRARRRLYTGNDARAAIVLRQLRDKVLDPRGMRALGFCVSVEHAEFMAQAFREAGIARWRSAGTRASRPRACAAGPAQDRRVNVLFAADLFNEGLDIPDVDTVLFLRPTESATIFLQQLGRGLRRTPDKAVLTVLDFVGHHRKEFRFDTQAAGADRGRPAAGSSGRSSAASRSCRPAARSSWTGRRSRWCSRTSAPRSPTGGRRWSPSCARTATRTCRRSFASPGWTSPTCCGEGPKSWTRLRRDAGLGTRPGRRPRAAAAQARPGVRPRRRRGPGRVATDACWPTTHRRTSTLTARRAADGTRCCSSRSGPTVGGFDAYDEGLRRLAEEQPPVRRAASGRRPVVRRGAPRHGRPRSAR